MNILMMIILMKEIKLHVETVVERFCNSFVIEFTSNMNLMVLTRIIVIFWLAY